MRWVWPVALVVLAGGSLWYALTGQPEQVEVLAGVLAAIVALLSVVVGVYGRDYAGDGMKAKWAKGLLLGAAVVGFSMALGVGYVAVFHRDIVRVENVVGKHVEKARQIIGDQNLVVGRQRSAFAAVDPKLVAGQQPRPRTKVDPGTEVDLVVSAGRKVPNVVGRTLSVATHMIEEAGLQLGPTKRRHDDERQDRVATQKPPAAAGVRPDSKVMLVVSAGIPSNLRVSDVAAWRVADRGRGGHRARPPAARRAVRVRSVGPVRRERDLSARVGVHVGRRHPASHGATRSRPEGADLRRHLALRPGVPVRRQGAQRLPLRSSDARQPAGDIPAQERSAALLMTAAYVRAIAFVAATAALAVPLSRATALAPAERAAGCDRGAALAMTAASTDLDQAERRWGVFCDPPGSRPRYTMRNVGSPSRDGRALECSYRGGTRYTGPHCYRNLRARAGVTSLKLALAFRFSQTTCNNAVSPSDIQALEFTASRWNGFRRAELAVQYEIVGAGAPQWRLWDGADWTAPAPAISQCLASDRWHALVLTGRIVDARVRYDTLSVDGRRHRLTRAFSQVRDRSKARLAVAVQADGNATSTPYRFWVDNVRLTTR